MLVRNRTKAEILLALGVVTIVGARILSKRVDSHGVFVLLLGLIGWIVFTYGCMGYAEGKGYSRLLGLLGLLACVGFAILVLLPDRHADDKDHAA